METPESQLKQQIDGGAGFVLAQAQILFHGHGVLEIFEHFKNVYPGPACFFQTCIDFKESPQNETSLAPSHMAAYTYMGFDRFETISVERGVTKITGDGWVKELEGNPFVVIADHLRRYKTAATEVEDEGFFGHGGAMGHFGFESVRYIEPVLNGHRGSFKMCEAQGQAVDIELFLFRNILIFDHVKGSAKLICGFTVEPSEALSQASSVRAVNALTAIKGYLVKRAAVHGHTPHGRGGQRSAVEGAEITVDQLQCQMGREKYVECVRQLKEHIAAGDIFQAVLSEKFEKKFDVRPLDLFRVLLENSPSAYQFYIETPQKALLGASPEMLLSVKKGVLETHPIAGTRPRGKDEAEERKLEKQLAQSTKENAEHLMLVDLARNDLGRISVPGRVKVGAAAEIKKFPGVMHLVTRVFGELKENSSALDALGACFPAGTLSGAPKIRAMQLLSELEASPRHFYGGAVGLISFENELEVCIAIRCAEVAGGQITFRAGAGIVADSRPNFEYDEILHKTRSLRRAIALAEEQRVAR